MRKRQLVQLALDEDMGPGDVTSEACISMERVGRATIDAKENLIVCGQDVARLVFEEVADRYAASVRYESAVPDGTRISRGERVSTIEGPARVLLVGERVALNLMMKLSGIATHVGRWMETVGAEGPRVVDTRKTTPLLRELEKHAVRCGGAVNHRMGLYDGVMIKDNHIVAAGGVAAAVKQVREASHHLLRIEVEVGDLTQLEEALAVEADVILLDNMTDEMLSDAVLKTRELRPQTILEASGNMTPERIARIKHVGVDVVSAGGLIHQATWVDLSMTLHDL